MVGVLGKVVEGVLEGNGGCFGKRYGGCLGGDVGIVVKCMCCEARYTDTITTTTATITTTTATMLHCTHGPPNTVTPHHPTLQHIPDNETYSNNTKDTTKNPSTRLWTTLTHTGE